jgi:hypothetical protein
MSEIDRQFASLPESVRSLWVNSCPPIAEPKQLIAQLSSVAWQQSVAASLSKRAALLVRLLRPWGVPVVAADADALVATLRPGTMAASRELVGAGVAVVEPGRHGRLRSLPALLTAIDGFIPRRQSRPPTEKTGDTRPSLLPVLLAAIAGERPAITARGKLSRASHARLETLLGPLLEGGESLDQLVAELLSAKMAVVDAGRLRPLEPDESVTAAQLERRRALVALDRALEEGLLTPALALLASGKRWLPESVLHESVAIGLLGRAFTDSAPNDLALAMKLLAASPFVERRSHRQIVWCRASPRLQATFAETNGEPPAARLVATPALRLIAPPETPPAVMIRLGSVARLEGIFPVAEFVLSPERLTQAVHEGLDTEELIALLGRHADRPLPETLVRFFRDRAPVVTRVHVLAGTTLVGAVPDELLRARFPQLRLRRLQGDVWHAEGVPAPMITAVLREAGLDCPGQTTPTSGEFSSERAQALQRLLEAWGRRLEPVPT